MSKKYFHIITIGCQMNKSDSERFARCLCDLGFNETKEIKKANIVVLTTCGVRQSAEDRIYGLVPKIKKNNPDCILILTGCLVNRKDVRERLKDKVDVWLPILEISNLKFKILNKLNKNKTKTKKEYNYLNILPKYTSKFSAFVPIGNGCNNFCTYCVVPYARGREVYRPAEEIINEVKDLVKKGYKEVILIAQNVNSYQNNLKFSIYNYQLRKNIKYNNLNFAGLLRLINDIEGDFWIRFATSHPKDMSDELINTIVKCKKVCRHIHLPAQSGDNKILAKMNRKYTIEHYIKLINKIRKSLNKASNNNYLPVSLTTDIIVGFPGETKAAFNNTIKLFKKIKFDMAYIAKYSPRYGTAAVKFNDNINKNEKKRREEKLMEILRLTALNNNKLYLGKTVKILIEGKNKKGIYYGKTGTNKNVKFLNTEDKIKIGEFKIIKINKVHDFGLEGVLN